MSTQGRADRVLERMANVAIIIAAIVLVAAAVRTYWLPSSHGEGNGASAQFAGRRLILPDVNWKDADRTLVLALSSTCGYCARSVPFYRKLGEAKGHRSGKWRIVAVFPQDQEIAKGYLSEGGVRVDQVVRVEDLSVLGVAGTPTVLLVDRSGTVDKAWVGFLGENEQTGVLNGLP